MSKLVLGKGGGGVVLHGGTNSRSMPNGEWGSGEFQKNVFSSNENNVNLKFLVVT